MYFVWSARRCLNPHWLRAAQSHFGTAPAPGHVRQVNNLVFWIDDSVVGYASDTASAVAKVEPSSNRSRETGRPYWSYKLIHGPQKQIFLFIFYFFFCLEIWILAWRSHGKIMELFSEIFVGTTLIKLDVNLVKPKKYPKTSYNGCRNRY